MKMGRLALRGKVRKPWGFRACPSEPVLESQHVRRVPAMGVEGCGVLIRDRPHHLHRRAQIPGRGKPQRYRRTFGRCDRSTSNYAACNRAQSDGHAAQNNWRVVRRCGVDSPWTVRYRNLRVRWRSHVRTGGEECVRLGRSDRP